MCITCIERENQPLVVLNPHYRNYDNVVCIVSLYVLYHSFYNKPSSYCVKTGNRWQHHAIF